MKIEKEKWSFKERLQFSSIIWFISVLAFFAPNITVKHMAEQIKRFNQEN